MDISRKEKLEKEYEKQLKKFADEYRCSARIPLDEKLTEDKLNKQYWRIQNHAIKHGIPTTDLKEALLNS